MNIRRTYLVTAVVMAWIAKATADGRITASEVLSLAEEIADLLGADLMVDLTDAPAVQATVADRARREALKLD